MEINDRPLAYSPRDLLSICQGNVPELFFPKTGNGLPLPEKLIRGFLQKGEEGDRRGGVGSFPGRKHSGSWVQAKAERTSFHNAENTTLDRGKGIVGKKV